MFCPQCGQQQVTGVVRFCSRCGFPLDGVLHLLNSGGQLPVDRGPAEPVPISPRRKGVKQGGAFAWSTGALSTPRLSEFCQTYSIQLAVGQTIEINLEVDEWFARVAHRLAKG